MRPVFGTACHGLSTNNRLASLGGLFEKGWVLVGNSRFLDGVSVRTLQIFLEKEMCAERRTRFAGSTKNEFLLFWEGEEGERGERGCLKTEAADTI